MDNIIYVDNQKTVYSISIMSTYNREEKKPDIVVVDQNNYKEIFRENAESNAKCISKAEAILNEEFQKNGYISKCKMHEAFEMLGIEIGNEFL